MALMYSKMDSLMKVLSGMESRIGAGTGIPMAMFMRGIGRMMLSKGRVSCAIQIRTSMMGTGIEARRMVWETIPTTMGLFTKGTFIMAGNRGLGL